MNQERTYGNFTNLENPEYFYKGSMYMMDLDGSLHTKWTNITISNGFAWTSNNKTMYYVDSIPRKVYKFDYNVDTGEIDYQGVAIDFVNKNEDFHFLGYPDGVAMDKDGMIWIACYDAAKVVRFNPDTGAILRIIDFKGLARRTTSCCFGGPNHEVLYVTSGGAQTEKKESKINMLDLSLELPDLEYKVIPKYDVADPFTFKIDTDAD
ncbi:hypothetical protein KUTeg_016617 [Tegillarca granosa]|uniref:SMP-30/Gluconolactonase/LRE-like region domain-containing protein n=1 Tax=Tegillarca granosa TaxID=220873 RepID=A0ABQ9ER57_TEGGR|nr:hypothetical protein KUTeg_016617 [Tegillarca granosa]